LFTLHPTSKIYINPSKPNTIASQISSRLDSCSVTDGVQTYYLERDGQGTYSVTLCVCLTSITPRVTEEHDTISLKESAFMAI